ncbi:MAG: methyltransferase domain-containing protein [Planctomycetaceae bacterium]|nr:methyltransferase domain-containing protein [Planctomycetaceae bacterium]
MTLYGTDRTALALACPHCRGSLEMGDDGAACRGCGRSYRGLRGIPDLRTGDDAFLSNRDDWAFARRLDEDYDRLDFRGLLERYFDLSPEVPADLRWRQVAHILTAPERARAWLEAVGGAGHGRLLDLGCGTGSFLAAVGAGVREAWGIDIALRWLLVARKRLDEEGLAHVRLACGCAERLPVRDRGFARVVAGDVIEHVGDQAATLAEVHRVLVPGGRLFLASPNRFSLAPEPHVQVWGVGYLPRRWMGPYVRWARGIDFRAIRTLGLGEWRRLLRRSPFGGGAIVAPGLPRADVAHFGPVKRGVARAYNALVTTRPGQAIARAVGPLFHVVCTRSEDGSPPTPTPATRRRSTPTVVPG